MLMNELKAFKEDMEKRETKFQYMLLSRFQQDCEYYLGHGNRGASRLWAGEETKHIGYMFVLYNMLEVKPEWLTLDEIREYAKQMLTEEMAQYFKEVYPNE